MVSGEILACNTICWTHVMAIFRNFIKVTNVYWVRILLEVISFGGLIVIKCFKVTKVVAPL